MFPACDSDAGVVAAGVAPGSGGGNQFLGLETCYADREDMLSGSQGI